MAQSDEHYTPGANYILSRTDQEKARLNAQHRWLVKHAYRNLLVDQSIQLVDGSCVLDAATGTSAWLSDLSKEIPATVELYGIDISDQLFPQEHPPNMKFRIGSVTELPSEWTGKFDVINQRLLIGALRTEEWPVNLAELYRCLKPGGCLQMCEVWSGWHARTDARAKVKAIVGAWCSSNGLDYDCGQKIPGQLTETGFVDVVARVMHPPSTYKQGEDGREGKDMAMRGFWMAVKDAAMKNAGFGVVSPEECEHVIDDFLDEYEHIDNPELPFVVITAQKPIS